MKRLLAALLLLAAPVAYGEGDAPEGPSVDGVLEELAKIGPEALVSRVEELRNQIDSLKAEAEAARQRAAELEAQSQATRDRVAAIEQFIGAVQVAMNPAPAEEAPAEEAPAEAPAEEAPAEAPAEEAPAEAPAEEAPAEEAPPAEEAAE